MDFINYFKKNPAVAFGTIVLLPLALFLLYAAGSSFYNKFRDKKEKRLIVDFLEKNATEEKAVTTEQLASATGVPRKRVINICEELDDIKDAGKRQKSWRYKTEAEKLEDDGEE